MGSVVALIATLSKGRVAKKATPLIFVGLPDRAPHCIYARYAGERDAMKKSLVFVALFFSACQTTTEQPEPKIWGRFDCQRAEDPAIRADFEQSRIICTGRAEAMAVSAGANVQPGRGLEGAFASALERRQIQQQVAIPAVIGCMAERGWTHATRPEHEARCTAPRAVPAATQRR